ncbi:hypothetical protein [Ornithinibacillus halotolerans]|uniref:Uncharacterized protein n=1 Tax=Ornithinibacillus halotolerans TaxID=1274357 RepID=A0A916WED1_9BACI|nr:hypothetical protein [Ornithinibacillus halotolerans]GGA91696.1 hypothetical protein GCM10008025_37730 [Ornithinibacillus halotolerans]
MEKWIPKSNEDQLLQQYWEERQGTIFVEVPVGSPRGIGNWPKGSKVRRIDGVRIENEQLQAGIFRLSKKESIQDYLSLSHSIELIEVKTKLNRLVIGQVIAGVDMFEHEYGLSKITPLIICSEGDPALEWVCDKRNINIYITR